MAQELRISGTIVALKWRYNVAMMAYKWRAITLILVNESLVKWENDLKMASLNKRRTIEYILEQSISTDTPIRYTQAEMDMKIAELTFGSTAREEKSSVALSYVPVVNENPTDNSSNEAITKSTSSMKQDTSKVVSENKDTKTASSRTTEENNSDNIFMNSAFAGLE